LSPMTAVLSAGRLLFFALLCYFLYHLYRALLTAGSPGSGDPGTRQAMAAVRLVGAASDASVWVEETPSGERRLGQGDAVSFADRLEVGRAPGNRLRISDPYVSAQHCVIQRRGNAFVLKDLSTNGTSVDGRPVRGECRLRPGVLIEVGRARFRFEER